MDIEVRVPLEHRTWKGIPAGFMCAFKLLNSTTLCRDRLLRRAANKTEPRRNQADARILFQFREFSFCLGGNNPEGEERRKRPVRFDRGEPIQSHTIHPDFVVNIIYLIGPTVKPFLCLSSAF